MLESAVFGHVSTVMLGDEAQAHPVRRVNLHKIAVRDREGLANEADSESAGSHRY